jgi:hypothetical protein
VSIDGNRDGDTFDEPFDRDRLNRQARLVWDCMSDGSWRTLADIAHETHCPEASVSARLRDFRKRRFGAHTVERERDTIDPSSGLFHYRLVPRQPEPQQLVLL